MKKTPADATGADMIDHVPIMELMPPVKDPRAFKPKPSPPSPPVDPTIIPPVGGPFVVVIQHKTKKTLHALTDPRKGPGALAVFTTLADAEAVVASAGLGRFGQLVEGVAGGGRVPGPCRRPDSRAAAIRSGCSSTMPPLQCPPPLWPHSAHGTLASSGWPDFAPRSARHSPKSS